MTVFFLLWHPDVKCCQLIVFFQHNAILLRSHKHVMSISREPFIVPLLIAQKIWFIFYTTLALLKLLNIFPFLLNLFDKWHTLCFVRVALFNPSSRHNCRIFNHVFNRVYLLFLTEHQLLQLPPGPPPSTTESSLSSSQLPPRPLITHTVATPQVTLARTLLNHLRYLQILTIWRPPYPMVWRTNSIISNIPWEGLWALLG